MTSRKEKASSLNQRHGSLVFVIKNSQLQPEQREIALRYARGITESTASYAKRVEKLGKLERVVTLTNGDNITSVRKLQIMVNSL